MRGKRQWGAPSRTKGETKAWVPEQQEPRITCSYRMTQGGRLFVIFSRGSPLLALRMASMS